eukprot:scaffold9096_cov25-Prasinocladus_malaysianus.AAC.1
MLHIHTIVTISFRAKDLIFFRLSGRLIIHCLAHLAEAPGGGAAHVVLGLLLQGPRQGHQPLAGDDGQREGLREGGDVAERHDARQPGVAVRLGDKVDERFDPSVGHHQLGELLGVLGDLADNRGGVLADELVGELEAGQDLWEDLRLDHNLGAKRSISRVLSYISVLFY